MCRLWFIGKTWGNNIIGLTWFYTGFNTCYIHVYTMIYHVMPCLAVYLSASTIMYECGYNWTS